MTTVSVFVMPAKNKEKKASVKQKITPALMIITLEKYNEKEIA